MLHSTLIKWVIPQHKATTFYLSNTEVEIMNDELTNQEVKLYMYYRNGVYKAITPEYYSNQTAAKALNASVGGITNAKSKLDKLNYVHIEKAMFGNKKGYWVVIGKENNENRLKGVDLVSFDPIVRKSLKKLVNAASNITTNLDLEDFANQVMKDVELHSEKD